MIDWFSPLWKRTRRCAFNRINNGTLFIYCLPNRQKNKCLPYSFPNTVNEFFFSSQVLRGYFLQRSVEVLLSNNSGVKLGRHSLSKRSLLMIRVNLFLHQLSCQNFLMIHKLPAFFTLSSIFFWMWTWNTKAVNNAIPS